MENSLLESSENLGGFGRLQRCGQRNQASALSAASYAFTSIAAASLIFAFSRRMGSAASAFSMNSRAAIAALVVVPVLTTT
jgi:hypothetical protein